MIAVTLRKDRPEDFEAALRICRAANAARRKGREAPVTVEEPLGMRLETPDTFLTVAEAREEVIGMALGMQGLAEDGAGPPVDGLCHVGPSSSLRSAGGRG
jgi:hypothetical protein